MSKGEFIYVIIQGHGEYEDYRERVVGAYFSKEMAESVVSILREKEQKNREYCAQLLQLLYDVGFNDYDSYDNSYFVREIRIFDFYEDDDDEELVYPDIE